ncbi:hypothetical protein TSAR_017045 [Trichomalopsis sarcophagae]|uniref:THAP-type domain-containing protein n=1 Tax=Trichomalopsis sarcophagae TaxID=543379 RepID=A0A232FAT9_9HYME|nr:hypothetical protein TSAR_017045 [Trichomalopsis sarcophagae]
MKFQFPKEKVTKRKCLEAIQRPEFVPTPKHGLCTNHFHPNDIIFESLRAGYVNSSDRLKHKTVPSIFPWQSKIVIDNSQTTYVVNSGEIISEDRCKGEVKFRFPKDKVTKRKCLEAIQRPDFVPTPKHGLRTNHFHPNDIIFESLRAGYVNSSDRLKHKTVPSIFPWQSEIVIDNSQTADVVNSGEIISEDSTINKHNASTTTESRYVNSSDRLKHKTVPSIFPWQSKIVIDNSQTTYVVNSGEIISEDSTTNKHNASTTTESSDTLDNDRSSDELFKMDFPAKDEKLFPSNDEVHEMQYLTDDFGVYEETVVSDYVESENNKISESQSCINPGCSSFKSVAVQTNPESRYNIEQLQYKPESVLHFTGLENYEKFMTVLYSLGPTAHFLKYDRGHQHYPTTRVIIYGTEIKIDRPHNPSLQQSSFSTYKISPTLKNLVGCTPGGLISYCSPAYGGSTSDRKIVERSDLMQKCESGDLVMADRCFTVQDIFAPYNITVATSKLSDFYGLAGCVIILIDIELLNPLDTIKFL